MCRKPLNGKMIVALAVFLALFMAAGFAEEERTDASGQWKYILEDSSATITGHVEELSLELVFPSELDGYAVTAIGRNAFDENFPELICITIPNSITRIGRNAFRNCSFPSVAIPASETVIDGNPFVLRPLTFFDVADDNPVYEQIDGVLFDKHQEILVSYPGARRDAYIIPDGVVNIGDSAFSQCGLSSLTIPGSVVSIGEGAFWGCTSLTSVTIPDSVTSVGYMAFDMCDNLTSAIVPASVTSIGDWAFGNSGGHVVTLTVLAGSHAEQYAKANNIPYTYTEAPSKQPQRTAGDGMRLAVFPTGTYNESYFFELSEDGILFCAVGARESDDITLPAFLAEVDHSAETSLGTPDLQLITGLCDALESSGYDTPKQSWEDAWDVALLYNGKVYEMDYWHNDGSPEIHAIVDKLIELSPIPVDLHGWA